MKHAIEILTVWSMVTGSIYAASLFIVSKNVEAVLGRFFSSYVEWFESIFKIRKTQFMYVPSIQRSSAISVLLMSGILATMFLLVDDRPFLYVLNFLNLSLETSKYYLFWSFSIGLLLALTIPNIAFDYLNVTKSYFFGARLKRAKVGRFVSLVLIEISLTITIAVVCGAISNILFMLVVRFFQSLQYNSPEPIWIINNALSSITTCFTRIIECRHLPWTSAGTAIETAIVFYPTFGTTLFSSTWFLFYTIIFISLRFTAFARIVDLRGSEASRQISAGHYFGAMGVVLWTLAFGVFLLLRE